MKKLKLLIAFCALLLGWSSASAKTDVTSTYLKDADLASLTGWGNPGKTDWKTDGAVNVVEFWNWTNQFNFSQTVSLPAGYYRLAVNAFYRNSWTGDGTNNNMAWIFAGAKTQNVVALTGMSELSGYAGSTDLYRAATAFSQGKYSNEFDFNVTGDGTTNVEIGFKGTCPNGGWCILGPVTLWEYDVNDYMSDYTAKKAEAEALYDTPMYKNDLDALKAAAVDEATLTTIDEVLAQVETLRSAIENANNSITNYAAKIAVFNTLKGQADAIAAVEYEETVAGSYSTFTSAISSYQTAANNAANETALNTAIEGLKTAIKTYINGAEPKKDGEYFDITCLMANPDFENGVSGWTYASAPGVNWSNCEYYQSEFDINQTVSGLPTGSYSLSVQAFQRPGWAANVWSDYSSGTDNASSVLYINSITSKVKNIAADAQSTAKLGTGNWGTVPNDSRVGEEGNYKYLPNSQQGAKLYFDANLYDATCAAVVTDADEGSLKLGFKSTKNHVDGDWTIFDNFRLYYYGSSLLVYYKQYLPQLKAEVSADLSNGAYANVLVSSEDEALDAALVATPASETEEAYAEVIDNLVAAQGAFRAAAPSYDAMVAAKSYTALTEITTNIGSGVFQYPTSTATKWTTYSSAKSAVDDYTFTTSSTAAGAKALVDALDDAIDDYNGITLNAPDPSKRYWITMHDAEKAWDGNAITFIAGGRSGEGDYNVQYLSAANANMNQALKFTAVDGKANTYKISGIRVADGTEQYLTGKKKGYNAGGNDQIRTTDDASKALEITVQATTTDNQFKLINETGTEIARNSKDPDNGVYADGNVGSYFTIAEASQAEVAIKIASNVKYATRIFPFVPELPDGVKAYSCAASEGNELTLVEVEEGDLAANVPYILEAESGCNETLQGWGTAGATSYTTGWLTGVYEATEAPVGSYVLQNNDKVAFYLVATDNQPTVGANRCYMTNGGGNTARAAFFFPGSITGVNNVAAAAAEAEVKDGKYIENGKVVIVKNGKKFSATGAQMK